MFTTRVRFARCVTNVRLAAPAGGDAPACTGDGLVGPGEAAPHRRPADPGAQTPPPARPDSPAIDRELLEAQRQQVQRVLAAIAAEVRALQQRNERSLYELRQVALELAMAVSSRILHERIEEGRFAIERMIDGALAEIDPRRPLTVALHPEDLELLAQRVDSNTATWAPPAELQLVPDPTLARASCRIEGPRCEYLVDANLLLEETRQFLLDHLTPCSD